MMCFAEAESRDLRRRSFNSETESGRRWVGQALGHVERLGELAVLADEWAVVVASPLGIARWRALLPGGQVITRSLQDGGKHRPRCPHLAAGRDLPDWQSEQAKLKGPLA
jgi:hypothetical protein